MNVLGTDAENNGLFVLDDVLEVDNLARLGLGNLDGVPGEVHLHSLALLGNRGVKEVHLRRTDKARDEEVNRIVVEVLRGVDLLHDAVLHDDDSGTHGHRLDLVVRDVAEGRSQSVVELGDLRSHLRAEFRVQVGQRLVEKEYLRLADDRTSQRDTLSLTAGERLRLTGEVHLDAEDTRRLLDPRVDFGLGHLAELETERHVVVNGHMGVQRVVLENHRDVAVLWRDVVDNLAVYDDLALADFLQAGYHAQRGGFAAAGGSDKDDELLVRDVDVEVLHGNDALVGDLQVDLVLFGLFFAVLGLFLFLAVSGRVGVDFLYVFQDYLCHVPCCSVPASAMTHLAAIRDGMRGITPGLHTDAPPAAGLSSFFSVRRGIIMECRGAMDLIIILLYAFARVNRGF